FDRCQAAIAETRNSAPSMWPKMRPKARRAALIATAQRSQVLELLDTVRRELYTGRHESHGLTYCSDNQEITVHTKKPIRRFHGRWHDQCGVRREARVLVIDANANEEVTGQLLDVTQFHTIPAMRQVELIQCASTRCATASLVPKRNADPKSKRAAR